MHFGTTSVVGLKSSLAHDLFLHNFELRKASSKYELRSQGSEGMPEGRSQLIQNTVLIGCGQTLTAIRALSTALQHYRGHDMSPQTKVV